MKIEYGKIAFFVGMVLIVISAFHWMGSCSKVEDSTPKPSREIMKLEEALKKSKLKSDSLDKILSQKPIHTPIAKLKQNITKKFENENRKIDTLDIDAQFVYLLKWIDSIRTSDQRADTNTQ